MNTTTNSNQIAEQVAMGSRKVRRRYINTLAKDVHRAFGHDVNGDLHTDDPMAAAVQCLSIWSMGGTDESDGCNRPADMREAVGRIINGMAGRSRHRSVARAVNSMLDVYRALGNEFPYMVEHRSIKDVVAGRRVSMDWLDLADHKVEAVVPMPIDLGTPTAKPVPAPVDLGGLAPSAPPPSPSPVNRDLLLAMINELKQQNELLRAHS